MSRPATIGTDDPTHVTFKPSESNMSKHFLSVGVVGGGAIFAALLFAACSSSSSNSTGDPGDGSGGSPTGAGGEGGTGTTGGSGNGGEAGGDDGCKSDADCAIDPAKPKCNLGSGDCVGCLLDDPCDPGEYCDPQSFTCIPGCTDDADCVGGMQLVCDAMSNNCVGCNVSTDCPQGTICVNQQCVEGCDGSQPCSPGETCCGSPIGKCQDLALDIANCGSCGSTCTDLANADEICVNGQCGMGACSGVYKDCNGDISDGCEQNTLQDGDCVCVPNSTQPCYQGAPGTENVGPCKGGTQTCNANGLGWGACVGQVLPIEEVCNDGIDQNCDAILDNPSDFDADGWDVCNGDCCDKAGPGCSSPKQVNPGAFEVIGNGVDDDCDPATSDVVAAPSCSNVQKFSGVTADDMVKAIELCQFTTLNPPMPQKKWGVLSAQQLLPNGGNPSPTQLANMQAFQQAVLQNYGTGGVLPKKGATMAGLSSGRMRDKNDVGYSGTSTSLGSASQPPAAYLAGNGGSLPASQGCSGACPAGSGANDGSNVRVTIRVPTNAQSFSYSFRFFSSEYWIYQCTAFNDFYLTQLTSAAPGLPVDKNISFDSLGNPVSVNNGFFDICPVKGCNQCPQGTGPLAGTGMDDAQGGGTVWLTTDAPVVPGETIVFEFMVFDVSDTILDSLALVDDFKWNLQAAQVGTHE